MIPRILFVWSLLAFALVASLRAAAPADAAALAGAIDAAIRARDVSALVALVHTEGMSEADKSQAAAGLAGLIPSEGAEGVNVKADRLPDSTDIAKPRVAMGRRIELTAPPAGIIRVSHKEGRASMEATLPYVVVAEGCLLAGRRVTDLGWTGPADKQLGFTFADDFPPYPCSITIIYEASGVRLSDTFTRHSGAILGQRIEEFTITGLPEGFKGRLVLREGKEEIFRSEPIVGQGTFTYRRAAR